MIRDIRKIPSGDGFFIAMTVAAICIICTVGAVRWQPYKPMTSATQIEKPIKDQARMWRDDRESIF